MNVYRWGALGLVLAAAAVAVFGPHEGPSRVLGRAASMALPSAHATQPTDMTADRAAKP